MTGKTPSGLYVNFPGTPPGSKGGFGVGSGGVGRLEIRDGGTVTAFNSFAGILGGSGLMPDIL